MAKRSKEEIILEMERNSNAWRDASAEERKALNQRNRELAAAMDALTGGVSRYDGTTGSWQLSDGTRSVKVGDRVEYLSPEGWTSPYAGEIENAFGAWNSKEPFSYVPESDPLYQSYRKQYLREGSRAAEDVLGRAAALTGGVPSSYAVSAASEAENLYNAKLADQIPALAELAYGIYRDEYDRIADRLELLMKAETGDYQRWADDRDTRYAWQRDALADQRYNDETAYQRQRDALADRRYDDETAYKRERDALADRRYDDETAYGRERDALDDRRYEDETAYGRERDALADQRYEDETAYDRARDALADARYRDETAYKRAQAAAKAAAKAAKDAEKETGQELRQENGDRRKAEYERPQSGQGRIGQLYTEMMAESDPLGWLSTHAKDLSDEELATLWGYVKTLMK